MSASFKSVLLVMLGHHLLGPEQVVRVVGRLQLSALATGAGEGPLRSVLTAGEVLRHEVGGLILERSVGKRLGVKLLEGESVREGEIETGRKWEGDQDL